MLYCIPGDLNYLSGRINYLSGNYYCGDFILSLGVRNIIKYQFYYGSYRFDH
jgi:hypothetical protein